MNYFSSQLPLINSSLQSRPCMLISEKEHLALLILLFAGGSYLIIEAIHWGVTILALIGNILDTLFIHLLSTTLHFLNHAFLGIGKLWSYCGTGTFLFDHKRTESWFLALVHEWNWFNIASKFFELLVFLGGLIFFAFFNVLEEAFFWSFIGLAFLGNSLGTWVFHHLFTLCDFLNHALLGIISTCTSLFGHSRTESWFFALVYFASKFFKLLIFLDGLGSHFLCNLSAFRKNFLSAFCLVMPVFGTLSIGENQALAFELLKIKFNLVLPNGSLCESEESNEYWVFHMNVLFVIIID